MYLSSSGKSNCENKWIFSSNSIAKKKLFTLFHKWTKSKIGTKVFCWRKKNYNSEWKVNMRTKQEFPNYSLFRFNESFSNQGIIYDILLIIIVQFSNAKSVYLTRIHHAFCWLYGMHKISHFMTVTMNKNNKLNISTYCLEIRLVVGLDEAYFCYRLLFVSAILGRRKKKPI